MVRNLRIKLRLTQLHLTRALPTPTQFRGTNDDARLLIMVFGHPMQVGAFEKCCRRRWSTTVDRRSTGPSPALVVAATGDSLALQFHY